MTGFVLKRTDQGGGFVARPGSEKSYTHSIRKARKYPTRQDANRDRCGNEIVVDLFDLMFTNEEVHP